MDEPRQHALACGLVQASSGAVILYMQHGVGFTLLVEDGPPMSNLAVTLSRAQLEALASVIEEALNEELSGE